MSKFRYAAIFPQRKGKLAYRRIECDGFIRVSKWKNGKVIEVDPEALALIAKNAFHDMSFYLA